MESLPISSGHLLVLLVFSGLHFVYFHLIKAFVPYIASDRKRLSWVLTVKAGLVLSLTGSYLTYYTIPTIFSKSVPSGSHCDVSPARRPMVISQDNITARARYDSHVVALGSALGESFTDLSGPAVMVLDPIIYHYRHPLASGSAISDFSHSDTIASRAQSRIDEPHFTNKTLLQSESVRGKGKADHCKATEAVPSRWFFDLRFTPADSWVGQMLTVYFISYLLMDLLCGYLYYREKVNILTGWFHHTVYICLCYKALRLRYAHILACHMVMEFPTFFMGLGQIHKPFRNDLLFAVTFFLFRIVLDCLLSHEVIANRPDVPFSLKSFVLFKSALHVKFLVDLIRQQIRLWSTRLQRDHSSAATVVHINTLTKAELMSISSLETREFAAFNAVSQDAMSIVSEQESNTQQRQRQRHRNMFRRRGVVA
ncbi:hypothetical protein BGZ68_002547 [Mortierella alpina]|nr:hypothetical protein BGZ68_002547 [Mortierella alpina]